MRTWRPVAARVVGTLVLALALLPVGGGVALAHSGGLEPRPSLPMILGVHPPVAGLTVEVIEAGARLRIDNGTGATVDVAPPPDAARRLEPIVPPGGTARWADPRVDAAEFAAGPAEAGWTIPLTVGEQAVTIRGMQVFPPPPATGLWWLATALAAVGATVLGALAVSRRPAAVATAGLTLVVVGAHVVHVLGASLVPEGQPYPMVVLGTAGIGLAAWLFGALGAALALTGRSFGLLLCALAGAMLAMVSAGDSFGFAYAVLPFGWSPDLDRATIVLTFGAGIGLFLTGFVVLRRLTPPIPTDDVEAAPVRSTDTAEESR